MFAAVHKGEVIALTHTLEKACSSFKEVDESSYIVNASLYKIRLKPSQVSYNGSSPLDYEAVVTLLNGLGAQWSGNRFYLNGEYHTLNVLKWTGDEACVSS